MKNLPRISIITPTYNQGKYIEQTILSVLSQDYHKLEYIIIDGKSTDNTLRILKKYGSRIKWISEKDQGQSDAINKGLKICTGDIVTYLNSDDIYLPGCLEKVSRYFSKNNKFLWFTGKCKIINDNGFEIRRKITLWKNFWLYTGYNTGTSNIILPILNYISQPSTFFRREVLTKIGLFNNNYKFSMDLDFWLRLSKLSKPGFIDSYLACFRIQNTSKSANNYQEQINESMKIIKGYTKSKIILSLHKFHDLIVLKTYQKLYKIYDK
jgi:glycosyltransferase involved in cell wall biosynthesis